MGLDILGLDILGTTSEHTNEAISIANVPVASYPTVPLLDPQHCTHTSQTLSMAHWHIIAKAIHPHHVASLA